MFTQRVREHMGPAPITVSPDRFCGTMVKLFGDHNASSVVVENAENRPIGIVTEQDVVKRVAFKADANAPASSVMSTPVQTISIDDYLFHALAHMRRLNLRHMPVVDTNGVIAGTLQQHHVFAAASREMIGQMDRLTHADTFEGLTQTKQAQASVAQELFQDNVPAPEVQRLLTHINNDLHKRIVDLCLDAMHADGFGHPPVEFEMVVLGSGGRGESFMDPDQDNGFILADYPDSDHDRIDTWFAELAKRVTKALDDAGFIYCKGHVMATNPLWRKSISQWKQQIDYWIGLSAGTVLRLCDIFFDFTPVYGSGELAEDLRNHVTRTADRLHFLREIFKVDEVHGVALGLFGKLQTDQEHGPNRGKINLKMSGTLPLVGAVRLFALRERIPHTSTLSRIQAIYDKGVLNRDEHDYLTGAFKHITNLMLRQQIADFQTGNAVSKHVAEKDLTKRDRDMLIDSLKAIRRFRERLRTELTAEIF